MLLLQRAQDVLQQQGDSGRQGPESVRHLGEDKTRLQPVRGGEEVVFVVGKEVGSWRNCGKG